MTSRRRFLSTLAALGAWAFPRRGLGTVSEHHRVAPTTFYVAADGSDASPGTAGTPWRTAAHVNLLLEDGFFLPGDTIRFRGGDTFECRISTGFVGAPGAPLTITSYGTGRATLTRAPGADAVLYGENVGHLIVDNLAFVGPGESATWGHHLLLTSHTSSRAGFEVRNCTFDANPRGYGLYLLVDGGATLDGLVVEDNTFNDCLVGYNSWVNRNAGWITGPVLHRNVATNCKGSNTEWRSASGTGFLIRGFVDGLVEHNYAYNNGELNNAGSGPCAFLIQNCWRTLVRKNIAAFQKSGYNDGVGFDLDNANEDVIVEYNYSYRCVGSGFAFVCPSNRGPVRGNKIRYNISANDATARFSAIDIIKDFSGGVFEDNEVYGNTVIKTVSGGRGALGIGSRHGTTRTRIHNNLVVTAGEPLFDLSGPPDRHTDLRVQGNLFHARDGRHRYRADGVRYDSLAELRSATPIEHAGGVETGLEEDPLLLSTELVALTDPLRVPDLAAYYRVALASPALDGGVDLRAATDLPGHDFFGAAIPASGPFRAVGAGTTPAE